METINHSTLHGEFLFVDSSVHEKQLLDFIHKNKQCKIISFDFSIHEILNSHNIPHDVSENFQNNFDEEELQKIVYDLSQWSKHKKINNFLDFNNVNIGNLFFDEIQGYFVKFLKYFYEIKSICESYPESKFFTYDNMYLVTRNFSNNVQLINTLKHEQEYVHDKIKLNINFLNFNSSIFIKKNHYKKIKSFFDLILQLLFKPSTKKTNRKKLLFVEFDVLKYKNFIVQTTNFDLEPIFFGIRRPAIWNIESFFSIFKSKCKIINPYRKIGKSFESQLTNNIKKMKNQILELYKNEILLKSVFHLDNISIWPLIKTDIATLLESRLDESIRDIMYTFENFKKYKIDGICILSEIGYTEQISIEIAKNLDIPIFLIQAGVYWDTKEANAMNISQGIYPFKSDFHLCFGLPQKNDCINNSRISESKIIPTGPVRYDELTTIKTNDGDYLLIATSGPQLENIQGLDHSNMIQYLKTIEQICLTAKKNNLKIIIKQHPSPLEYPLKDFVKKIDKNIIVLSGGDITPLIKNCKFLISVGISSVILEALILKKLVLVFNGIDYGWGKPKILDGCEIVYLDNLEIKIHQIISDQIFRNHLEQRSQKFLQDYISNLGNSIRRSHLFIKNSLNHS